MATRGLSNPSAAHHRAGRKAWLRIQHCRHGSALFWGRDEPGRWNAPNGQFGVLYASDTVAAAFAETFGRDLMATHAPAALKFISGKEPGCATTAP